ncbi:MAG: hypothetical protein SGJ27_27420 [Candidatus Melainabacteria bacterium]|nr:hypothetical protein [Candidatus Melainabacteria bacterium]
MKLFCTLIILFIASATVTSPICVAQGEHFPDGNPDGGRPLQLTQAAGSAPLNVRINGPDEFLEKVRSWNGRMSIGGRGFSIDRGDGPQQMRHSFAMDNQGKEGLLSHTYTVPGSYRVSATTYRPGPTDAPIYNWKSSAMVTVSGGIENKTSLQTLAPGGGETFNYQEFPTVRWSLATDRRVGNGNGSAFQEISYTAPGSI